ncbi:hypothetical protein WA026_020062 [Henosepilachna vigintioctopunctata]|uniref:Lipid droplet-regulating VLDL assembly factor AUP1 n=1 Tax=Henosepilachna vigintioctopunctata TaxID=420089 RepID=A0AAW1UEX4_9CUCU
MSNTNVELPHLLRKRRFTENEWMFLFLLCYLPIGITLFILRSILAISVFLLGFVLPDVPLIRKIINKSTCLSLGITVGVENIEKKEAVSVYISNCLSLFDSLAVNFVTGAVCEGPKLQPLIAKSIGILNSVRSSNTSNLSKNADLMQRDDTSPLYFAPEGKSTTGKALLTFGAHPFSLATRVQPICISIERPFLDIAVTSLGSSSLADIFFYMFSPLTNYKLKFLAAVEKENQTDEEFADTVRRKIANALKIEAVNITKEDLVEWEKLQLAEQKRIRSQQTITSSAGIPVLKRMTLRVKEVFPHVPYEVIYKDLYRTRNVDNTITNILEGRVQFVPEIVGSSNRGTTATTSSSGGESSNKIIRKSVLPNVSVSSFAKSAPERTKSFQERKEQLIAYARKRYIEKHNLDLSL